MQAFLIAFGAATVPANVIKFIFSLSRPRNAERYPIPNFLVGLLGILQLAFGVWGMTLIFPNFDLFSNASKDTCETGSLVSAAVVSMIMAIVIVGSLLYVPIKVLYSKKRSAKQDEESPQEPEGTGLNTKL